MLMPEVFSAEEKKEKKQLDLTQSGGSLSSFVVRPKGVRFETQDKDEEVVLLLRQHPVVNVGWVISAIVMLVLPGLWELIPNISVMPARFVFFTMLFWYLLVTAFVIEKFLNWYFNVYIVTDDRIVDIDFWGLLYKNMTVVRLESIEEVNYTQAGGLAAMFNLGDIYIQTAAERREAEFLRVAQPEKIVGIIYGLMEKKEK